MPAISPSVEEKYAKLQSILRDLGRVVVAYSGGVDSTLLLKVAVDTLGVDRVLAIIGETELLPEWEVHEAIALAETIGASYRVVHVEALGDARVASNPPDRCYYCKANIFGQFVKMAQREGYAAVVDGTNADDAGDWRPGERAAGELCVRSPLRDAGMTKADIRELSHALGLPTWSKPSYACLASRVPYGTPLTREILLAVAQAEAYLRELGFTQLRVRHHDELARIELTADELPRLLDPNLRAKVTSHLKELGYRYVTVDLQGYRTGSMNEVL